MLAVGEEDFWHSYTLFGLVIIASLLLLLMAVLTRLTGRPWLGPKTISSPFERVVNSSTSILFKPCAANETLLERCPSLSKRGFQPTPWLLGHSATLLGNGCRAQVAEEHCRFASSQDVILPDGGLIRLKWMTHATSPASKSRPLMLLVPGTRGDSRSPYIRQLAYVSFQKGYDIVVAPLRGCGVDKLATIYCLDGSSYTDFQHILTAIRQRRPTNPIVCTSFSMGAGFLAHYVAESQHKSGLVAAVCISAASDYTKLVHEYLQDSVSGRLFQRVLLSVVKRNFRPHAEAFRNVPGVSVEQALRAVSIPEWHRHVTCPLRNVATSRDFCESVSFDHLLGNVKIPLLFINDDNDPLTPSSNISEDVLKENDKIILCRTKGAGHTSFLEGMFPFGGLERNTAAAWDTRVALEFLGAALEDATETNGSGVLAAAGGVGAAAPSSSPAAPVDNKQRGQRPFPVILPLDLEDFPSRSSSKTASSSPASSLLSVPTSDRSTSSSLSSRRHKQQHGGRSKSPRGRSDNRARVSAIAVANQLK
jgi:predicted alpha/beta-fold hydrolase